MRRKNTKCHRSAEIRTIRGAIRYRAMKLLQKINKVSCQEPNKGIL